MRPVGIARWAAIGAGLLVLALVGCKSTGSSESGSSSQTGSEFDQGAVDTTDAGNRKPVALETVYFAFDRYDIRPEAQAALAKNAKAIRENSAWGVVTVEGNTDERGSEEYNLALGERRANAVKRYLVDLGVPGDCRPAVVFGITTP